MMIRSSFFRDSGLFSKLLWWNCNADRALYPLLFLEKKFITLTVNGTLRNFRDRGCHRHQRRPDSWQNPESSPASIYLELGFAAPGECGLLVFRLSSLAPSASGHKTKASARIVAYSPFGAKAS